MLKIFDNFTKKRYCFITKEEDMIEVLNMIQSVSSPGYSMCIGNCKWTEEPDLWFIHIDLTDNKWGSLLKECKDKKYKLIIKDNPYRMYFEKTKES